MHLLAVESRTFRSKTVTTDYKIVPLQRLDCVLKVTAVVVTNCHRQRFVGSSRKYFARTFKIFLLTFRVVLCILTNGQLIFLILTIN